MWLENLLSAKPSEPAAPVDADSAPLLDVVTGAFGFSGKYITALLLQGGRRVRTLTNHAPVNATGTVVARPLDFSDMRSLVAALRGAKVLYNSYWVRFAYRGATHATAVANSKTLIRAAEEAGVKRIVHISITNPSLDSPFPYFRGKAEVEEAIRASSLSYAILRPAVLFGEEDILINNIAWLLRRFPVFAIPGNGAYCLQPISAEDLAALAVKHGAHRDNVVLDAVGPETYTYQELVQLVREVVESRSAVVHMPPRMVGAAAWVLGRLLRDVVLTEDEVGGLMANLLVSLSPPTGTSSLKSWLLAHAHTVGRNYASELSRHYR